MKKLQKFQAKADKAWGFEFPVLDEINSPQKILPNMQPIDPALESKLSRLEYCVLALAGEVGELANLAKKVRRSVLLKEDPNEELFHSMKDETADILAYLLKLSNLMSWDLESTYLNKMERNKERFGPI